MKKLLLSICLAFIGFAGFAQGADSLFTAKDYVKAVEAYQIEIKQQPNNLVALRRLAFCYTNIENTSALAVIYFKKALEIDPKDMASNYYLGLIYKAQNKAQAIAYFKIAAAAGSEEAASELASLK